MSTGDRLSVWEDENALEGGGGDGCATVRRYFMPLNSFTLLKRYISCYKCFTTIKLTKPSALNNTALWVCLAPTTT